MEKIRVGGIRLSSELVQVNLVHVSDCGLAMARIGRVLAENSISMHFLLGTRTEDGCGVTCCVAVEDGDRVRRLVEQEGDLKKHAEFVASVGLVSVFPHETRLRLLGASLEAFGRARIPIYGLASSLSALTFVTGYAYLSSAVASLEEVLLLPRDHAPFGPEIRVTQTRLVRKE